MDEALRVRLDGVADAYRQTVDALADPAVFDEQDRYRALAIRHAELRAVVEVYDRYRSAEAEASAATELVRSETEPEMRAYLESVVAQEEAALEAMEIELRTLLVPADPNDAKDVIVEVRAAAGGDEAALWAGDLVRLYHRFAERNGFAIDAMGTAPTESGGIKEATFAVKGKGAYSLLKFEAGPHRVQRVPKTESSGRIHTSIATVAVLPEAEDVEVAISDSDLEIETFRSQGPGGQSVNTTDSAVRIRHLPTGIVVSCQDEKSQLQNKAKAMRVLRARLFELEQAAQAGERGSVRRSQVGSGERAEKIRTYNYKENRVTDHRVGLTIHDLAGILDGDLAAFHAALGAQEAAQRLADQVP
ncbi:MAG: peptide chain release factor 1 [Actinomycetota bacterium]|nr:peptide chain release factor 1 [Actinomycetota bacterium]